MFCTNDGTIVIIKRTIIDDELEPKDRYIERCRFINKFHKQIDSEKKLETFISLSEIYANIKLLNCKYSKEVMEKINNLIESLE